jgi:hypothetical protein
MRCDASYSIGLDSQRCYEVDPENGTRGVKTLQQLPAEVPAERTGAQNQEPHRVAPSRQMQKLMWLTNVS